MKRLAFLAFFLFVFMLFSSVSSITSQAQGCRADRDCDGVLDTADRCPSDAGPASNNGCPLPGGGDNDNDGDGVNNSDDRCPNTRGVSSNNGCPPPDSDGDGTPDDQDRCPDTGGLASNAGCPEGEEGTTPTDPCVSITASPDCAPNNDDNNSSQQPDLPNRGYCVLGTRFGDRVNIRIRPSTLAEIVGQLSPGELVPVLETLDTIEGRWYRIPDGWVFGDVIHLGGRCKDPVTSDRPEPEGETSLVECPGFIAINPVNITVAGQTLFSWTSPINVVPVAFYQINLYDENGNWLFDTYTFEPTTQVVIDLSQVNLGLSENFQWNVVALDIDEEPLCATDTYTAHTGDIQVSIGSPNGICGSFMGVGPMDELGNYVTEFSWTLLADVPYYHLKLYNSDGEMVEDTFTIAMGALGGYSFITSPEAIGEGDAWSWQVDAHWANWNIACSTPLYPLNREAQTGQTPVQPNPEGLCDAFAILSPEDNYNVQADLNLVPLTWHGVNQPVLMAYTVFAGVEGGEMLPQFSTPDTAGTLELSQFGDATDIQWMVKAYSASALAVLSCESPVYHIHRGESEETANRPGRGINFPNIDPSIIIDWACPQVQVIIFSDGVQSSYFQWLEVPGAAGYRMNFYNAEDALVDSHDMDGFVQALVMQVPFGPKDEWSFDLQLLTAGGTAYCSSQRYYIERDFESSGGISFVPANLELVECAGLEAISPLDELGSGLFTYFEWTNIDDVAQYDIKIYDSNDVLQFWGVAFPDDGQATETRAFYTDAAHIGAGTDFSWEVIATLESDISCSTGKIPVTRPSNGFAFLPDVDVSVSILPLIECAGFEALGPLEELGEGQISYFIWTNLDNAVEYQVRLWNQNDYLMLWAVEVADHPGDTEGGVYQTDEAGIGGGNKFSWDVTAILEDGTACTTPRVEVTRKSHRPNFPHVDIWDLTDFKAGDEFIDPETVGGIDFCKTFLPAVQFPTDQIPTDQNEGFMDFGDIFGLNFCFGAGGGGGAGEGDPNAHGSGGGGGAGVGDPLAQCGAFDAFLAGDGSVVPGDGSVNVLNIVGAVDMFRPGGIYSSLNFCNPVNDGLLLPAVRGGDGLLLPAVKVFFLDAEAMGHDAPGTLVLIIAIEPNPEGGILLTELTLFSPEDNELNFTNVQKIIEDGMADPPGEFGEDGLEGYLIGLLNQVGLESLPDNVALNFTNIENVLRKAGGVGDSFVNMVMVEMMQ